MSFVLLGLKRIYHQFILQVIERSAWGEFKWWRWESDDVIKHNERHSKLCLKKTLIEPFECQKMTFYTALNGSVNNCESLAEKSNSFCNQSTAVTVMQMKGVSIIYRGTIAKQWSVPVQMTGCLEDFLTNWRHGPA